MNADKKGTVEATYSVILQYVHKSNMLMIEYIKRLEANRMIKCHHSNGMPILFELLPESNYFKSPSEIDGINKRLEGLYYVQ